MNGPKHYTEAERLLCKADDVVGKLHGEKMQPVLLAAAQVHATLALAAATVQPARDWREVLDIPPTSGPPLDGEP